MKPQVTLLLICIVFAEALQISEALKCYQCFASCTKAKIVNCSSFQDYCYTSVNQNETLKKCAAGLQCIITGTVKPTCCKKDLCNRAEGIHLGLSIMLGHLLSSIFFP